MIAAPAFRTQALKKTQLIPNSEPPLLQRPHNRVERGAGAAHVVTSHSKRKVFFECLALTFYYFLLILVIFVLIFSKLVLSCDSCLVSSLTGALGSSGRAILICPDIWGWDSGRLRNIADHLADAGYLVVVPKILQPACVTTVLHLPMLSLGVHIFQAQWWYRWGRASS